MAKKSLSNDATAKYSKNFVNFNGTSASIVLWQKIIFHCNLEIQTKLKNPYCRIHLLGQLWICYKLLCKPWKSINNSQLKFIMFYPTKLQTINSIIVERVR